MQIEICSQVSVEHGQTSQALDRAPAATALGGLFILQAAHLFPGTHFKMSICPPFFSSVAQRSIFSWHFRFHGHVSYSAFNSIYVSSAQYSVEKEHNTNSSHSLPCSCGDAVIRGLWKQTTQRTFVRVWRSCLPVALSGSRLYWVAEYLYEALPWNMRRRKRRQGGRDGGGSPKVNNAGPLTAPSAEHCHPKFAIDLDWVGTLLSSLEICGREWW